MVRPTPDAPHLDVAGWLLGALDPDEAAAFEAHIATCTQCQEEVKQLRPTLVLLSTAARDVDVPPLLADRTVSAVQRAAQRRRRRSWAARGLVAAALVAALTLGAAALFARTSTRTFDFAMSSPNGGLATGNAIARSTGSGWSIKLSLRGLADLDDKAFYECWYVDPAKDTPGHPFRISAGSFDAAKSGAINVQMWSSADPHDFPVMQITVEPVDGNPAASQDVVLTGVARLH